MRVPEVAVCTQRADERVVHPIARIFLRRPRQSLRAILRSFSTRFSLLCADVVTSRRMTTDCHLAGSDPPEVAICAVYDVRSPPGSTDILLLHALNPARELTVCALQLSSCGHCPAMLLRAPSDSTGQLKRKGV